MKKVIFALGSAVLLFADSPLSTEKAKLWELKKQKLQKDTAKLKNSWISPLKLFAKYNRSVNAGNFDGTSYSASLQLRQDIFRSGGIWYAIDYAKAFGEAQALGIEIKKAAQMKMLYMLKVKIEREKLKLRQSKLLLKNRLIDVEITKESYQSGNADISMLNRVVIDSDNARNRLINAKNMLRNEKIELKKLIGDKSVEELEIPKIPLVDKDFYLKHHLELLRYKKQSDAAKAQFKAVRSNYLPKVTVNANYGYSKFRGDFQNYDGDEYGYGIGVSMPLDINTKYDVESNKLAYLQTRLEEKDREKELEIEYDKRLYNIDDFKQKMKVSRQMLKMYDELYRFTLMQVKAGLKTASERDSLANSKKIQQLEYEIQQKNIELEKMALFFDLLTLPKN